MFKTLSVVGPTDGSWSQTLTHHNLLAVIEIEEGETDARSTIHHLFTTIAAASDAIPEMDLAQLKMLLGSLHLSPQTHMLLGYIAANVLYLVSSGNGAVHIKRDNKCVQVLSANTSMSGLLKPDDRIIFCSPTFAQLIQSKNHNELFGQQPFTVIAEQLAALVHKENAAGAAALMALYGVDEKQPDRTDDVQSTPFFARVKRILKRAAWDEQYDEMVHPALRKKKRITIGIGIILLLLLIGSLTMGTRKREQHITGNELEVLRQTTTDKLKEGTDLVELNALQARRTLAETKKTLTDALPRFPEGSAERTEVEQLISRVDDALKTAQRIFTVDQPALFFDLAWIKEGAKGIRMDLSGNTLAILDPTNQSVYSLSLPNKKATIAANGAILSQAQTIALHNNDIFTVVNGEKKQILNSQLTELADGSEWGTITDAVSYAGNIYLLDTKGVIWKYPQTDATLASGRNYLASDSSVNFESAQSLAIDGNVWVLAGNRIQKFTRGIPQNYTLKEEMPNHPIRLYTDEDIPYLYILDNEGTLRVFDKDGNYQEQFHAPPLANADDMVVVVTLKKALILKDGKLYAIDVTW